MQCAIDPFHSAYDENIFWSVTTDAMEEPSLSRLAWERWPLNWCEMPCATRYQKNAQPIIRAKPIVGCVRTKDLDHYADRRATHGVHTRKVRTSEASQLLRY